MNIMETAIARQLIEINRRFYADFGLNFSATRQRIQPGVRRIISSLDGTENILDLGCGNGQLARTLAELGFHGTYLGLDFSQPLLVDARSQPEGFSVEFREADLAASDWDRLLQPAHYSIITAFAVLHHIPDQAVRIGILRKVRRMLKPGGKFIHSHWQFLNSEKLRSRLQTWQTVGLSASDVDEGDSLLDWRAGGNGLRYAHHFTFSELDTLARETGFKRIESFLSDGEGGRLGLYQVWEAGQDKP